MEDVSNLTKEEFLKFLNCSHHSAKPEKIVVVGPRKTKFIVLKQFGKFLACGVQLDEFSLNNKIIRIPLPKINLENLSPKEITLKFKPKKVGRKGKKGNVVSSFGRKLKKKQLGIQNLSTSIVSTRSSLKYSTRSSDKNKKIVYQKPTVYKKITKSLISNSFAKKMAAGSTSFKQNQKNTQIKPIKPQFIIKYVPSEPTYFLKMSALKHPEDGKLEYAFDTLVKDIKNMKLPSPTWKIKVVVKSNKIASIIFTNKCVLERTVSFSAKSDFFEVVIENKPAILLGSPNSVTCVEDIEVLLNIIHTISAQNPMVYYKNK